jgi:hypothetical protein
MPNTINLLSLSVESKLSAVNWSETRIDSRSWDQICYCRKIAYFDVIYWDVIVGYHWILPTTSYSQQKLRKQCVSDLPLLLNASQPFCLAPILFYSYLLTIVCCSISVG